MVNSAMTGLRCSMCGTAHAANELQTVCSQCGRVLVVEYDLERAAQTLTRDSLRERAHDLWRFAEIMPVDDESRRVTLGEGGTPLLNLPTLGQRFGMSRLLVKDESRNPTGSFKARGLCAAVARAAELGATAICLPSAGNAASAASAYAARAGLGCIVIMPQDTPPVFLAECATLGAQVYLVDGLINDAGRILRDHGQGRGWFDVSTLKEPYRAEGKKTMGLEIAEQLGWRLPDVIVYPTGGGTGIVGMWKAFDELERMGFIGPERPRMVVVQSTGCAPIVRAFERHERHAELWQDAATIAPGMRVPVAIGDYLILDAVRTSEGTAIAIDDMDTLAMTRTVAETEGLFLSPECGAVFAAIAQLRESGFIGEDDETIAFGTGSGLKHTELFGDVYPVLHPDDPGISTLFDQFAPLLDATNG